MTFTVDPFWAGFSVGWFLGICFIMVVALIATRRAK